MSAKVQILAGSAQLAALSSLQNSMRLDSDSDMERVARACIAARGWRSDAGLTQAFARSLEYIFTEVLSAEFAEYRAHDFFPGFQIDPGALSFTYRMKQRMGNVNVISSSGRARDLPKITLGAQEWQAPVITLGGSYDWSVIEQASASMMNLALEAEKGMAVREAMEEKLESIYCTGYASAGVVGVTNAPGIAAVTQVSTGSWISQILGQISTGPLSATLVQLLAGDVNAMKFQISSKTLKRRKATDCLLPPNLYDALDFVPESTLFHSKNLLTWMEEFTGLDFDYWPILLNAGGSAGSPLLMANVSGGNPAQNTRAMVYEKDPKVVGLVDAGTFVQLAPQATGLMYEVPCYDRTGGAMARLPLGAVIMDGL